MLKINDTYSIIKGCDTPLSSDCGIYESDKYLYIIDVGSSIEILNELNEITKPKVIILTHFHKDHISNLNDINYEILYVGDNTYKYTKTGNIIYDKIEIDDGIKLQISKLTNSHARGSLAIKINDYCFVGDSLAPQIKKDGYVYNVQFLKQEIDELKNIDVKYFVDSHNMETPKNKMDVINSLENIYKLRQKDSPYIKIK